MYLSVLPPSMLIHVMYMVDAVCYLLAKHTELDKEIRSCQEQLF